MVIAVIGLGHMGRAMAERLAERGFELRVWNRTRERADGLAARACDDPAAAAEGAEVVVSALADDRAVREVALGARGILAGLGAGAVHVGTSTISRGLSEELARAHAARGRSYLAATVLGRSDAARAGRLFVFAGGDDAARERARPALEALGQRTLPFADAAQAALAKILVNLMLAGTIELLGEVLALGEKGGIDPARTASLLADTLFGCPAIAGYGERIAARAFTPAGFAMPLGLKDVELALSTGGELRVPLPAASVVRDHLLAALARGLADHDWSALTTAERAAAGLASDGSVV